jgi:hypothetical protein
MRRIGLAGIALALLGAAMPARGAERIVSGMLISHAGSGFWARFAQPVENGVRVRIRAFREGENVGAGRIEWASPIAPYEAYIVDVRSSDTAYVVSPVTPYMALTGEKFPPDTAEREAIAPGFYVIAPVAERRPVRPFVNPIAATLEMLAARPEARGMLPPPLREPGRLPGALERWLAEARRQKWNDPVTARLIARLADMAADMGLVGGSAPPDWFPPALAKEKKAETAPNP